MSSDPIRQMYEAKLTAAASFLEMLAGRMDRWAKHQHAYYVQADLKDTAQDCRQKAAELLDAIVK